jgi:hypothetical protein
MTGDNFTKFVSLIDKGALFFVRADKLDDPFEGAITKKMGIGLKTTGGYRRVFFVNSWHMSDFESAAMWKLYLKSDEGVAIQTTFKRLANAFNASSKHEVFIGKVKYTDYENEVIPQGNLFNRFLNKRKSFEHEKEVRAMLLHIDKNDDALDEAGNYIINSTSLTQKRESAETGVYVDVNLDSLIQKIYISPYSKKWFASLVQSIINKYGIKADVIPSGLMDKPTF